MQGPEDLPELRADLDESLCFACQGGDPCNAGVFCVMMLEVSPVQKWAAQQLEARHKKDPPV